MGSMDKKATGAQIRAYVATGHVFRLDGQEFLPKDGTLTALGTHRSIALAAIPGLSDEALCDRLLSPETPPVVEAEAKDAKPPVAPKRTSNGG